MYAFSEYRPKSHIHTYIHTHTHQNTICTLTKADTHAHLYITKLSGKCLKRNMKDRPTRESMCVCVCMCILVATPDVRPAGLPGLTT